MSGEKEMTIYELGEFQSSVVTNNRRVPCLKR